MNLTNKEITSTVELALAKINRQFTQPRRWLLLFLFVMCFTAVCTTQARAQTLGANNHRRYDQNAYLESHAAFTTPSANYPCFIYCNQGQSIGEQLDDGVRSLDLRIL